MSASCWPARPPGNCCRPSAAAASASRCRGPTAARRSDWLVGQGVPAADAAGLLRAAGGRPSDALRLAGQGQSPKAWSLLPKAMSRGDVGALSDHAPAQAIGALQKLCHDLMAVDSGAAPRFFEAADLPPAPSAGALARWSTVARQCGKNRRTPVQCGPDARGACERGANHPKLGTPSPMNTPAAPTPSAPVRPSVIQLAIKEKGALYAAYIPLFAEGGIFIPTSREYRLGDDVYVLLTLPDDPQRYPVAGKVAWITPARAAGNRAPGVGIRFPSDEKSRQLKARIEEALGGTMASDRPTQTI